MWIPPLKWGIQNRALLSLVLDSLALPALEDEAIEIRLIDEGCRPSISELSMLILRWCGCVHCMYASTIESFLYVPWIPYLQRLTSISETESHLAVLYNHPQFSEVIVIKNLNFVHDLKDNIILQRSPCSLFLPLIPARLYKVLEEWKRTVIYSKSL